MLYRKVSRPYIGHMRDEAVNANVYTSKGLPKMLKFINTAHLCKKILFWPGLVSFHYARTSRI